MNDNDKKLAAIRKKSQQRFLFAGITLALYMSFVLPYTQMGSFLNKTLGDSLISGALVLFVALILIFLVMEYLFIHINEKNDQEQD